MKKSFFWLLVLMATAADCVRAQGDRASMAVSNDDAPLVMDKMDVEAVINRPWLYVEIPGVQVLSLASKRETAEFVELVRADQAFFAKLVPEIPESEVYAESTVILKSPAFARIHDARGSQTPSLSYLTGLNAGLDMEIYLFGDETTLPEGRQGQSVVESAAGFFYQSFKSRLLGKHRELPEWYRRGMQECGISQQPDTRRTFHAVTVARSTLRALGLEKPSLPGVQLWPLEKFLATTRPAVEVTRLARRTSPEGAIYDDQCALFVHWGLRGGGDGQREAFRRFVAEACKRPVDEALFRACFGFGFDEGQRRFEKFALAEIKAGLAAERSGGRVRNYLDIRSSGFSMRCYEFLETNPPRGKKTPKIEIKPAQLTEVWRIMGQAYLWSVVRVAQVDRQKLVWDSPRVKQSAPILADSDDWRARVKTETEQRFLSRAQELMYKVYVDKKALDPQLLAVLGQLELAMGNREKAVGFLQAAVDAGTTRPSVYYILARLRLDELADPGMATGGKRTPKEQIEVVKVLLREALQRMPEMEPAYGALAYAWRFSEEVPTKGDLDALVRSVRWFPENAETTRAVAALCKKAGRDEQAAALAKIGLDWLPRRGSEELRSELTALATGVKSDAP